VTVSVPGIDDRAVTAWTVANIDGIEPPLRFSGLAGGNSNLTYRVDDAAGRTVALRRPPLGHVLQSAHDMAREYRVISALAGTGVPVPAPLALCTDVGVNGTDFYVMGFVAGAVLHDADDARSVPDDERLRLSEHVADVLAALHSIDPDDVGLGDLGRREAYIERQLRRWARQWEQTKQRDIPAMERVHAELARRIPEQRRTGIVHGDYRLGNMIVGGGEVRAVLDWELCTLGDPMADLGYLLNNWSDPGEPVIWRASPSQAGGFWSASAMIERYAARTGADTSDVAYYQAFQGWRLAAIMEGVYARYLHGAMGSAEGLDLGDMGDSVIRLAEMAERRLT
jgi:aminoglycoside phosphotransferase (APT) family kinase protein